MARKGNDEKRPIIIKRVKKGGGRHHSSAWKVAYADFTTAMMAFFMLLWLLNVTTEEQRSGIADYFAPTSASSSSTSGSGGVLGGTALATDGSMNSGAVLMTMPKPSQVTDGSATGKGDEASMEKTDKESEWQKAMSERENQAFAELEAQLRQAIQDVPELASMTDHIVVDITDDGMRIQVIDKDNRAMFKNGTSDLYGYARTMLQQIANRLVRTPNRITVTGHTDSQPAAGPAGYSNWELSSDRANSARRVLRSSGISEDRFSAVRGKAATEPLLPDQPNRPENRRITILLLREAPVLPPKL
ncbi:flagellar motor protein MotB [Govanella unica]|uniref:OmpA family protein n=1 Tax=Govanella unica TaxID=2975056 RepID=A0A9X3TWW3_9PROT|nr:flagellar motor protein MotB [Govania unica]MDA5193446.1 OmpA family protein [Govania unica]